MFRFPPPGYYGLPFKGPYCCPPSHPATTPTTPTSNTTSATPPTPPLPPPLPPTPSPPPPPPPLPNQPEDGSSRIDAQDIPLPDAPRQMPLTTPITPTAIPNCIRPIRPMPTHPFNHWFVSTSPVPPFQLPNRKLDQPHPPWTNKDSAEMSGNFHPMQQQQHHHQMQQPEPHQHSRGAGRNFDRGSSHNQSSWKGYDRKIPGFGSPTRDYNPNHGHYNFAKKANGAGNVNENNVDNERPARWATSGGRNETDNYRRRRYRPRDSKSPNERWTPGYYYRFSDHRTKRPSPNADKKRNRFHYDDHYRDDHSRQDDHSNDSGQSRQRSISEVGSQTTTATQTRHSDSDGGGSDKDQRPRLRKEDRHRSSDSRNDKGGDSHDRGRHPFSRSKRLHSRDNNDDAKSFSSISSATSTYSSDAFAKSTDTKEMNKKEQRDDITKKKLSAKNKDKQEPPLEVEAKKKKDNGKKKRTKKKDIPFVRETVLIERRSIKIKLRCNFAKIESESHPQNKPDVVTAVTETQQDSQEICQSPTTQNACVSGDAIIEDPGDETTDNILDPNTDLSEVQVQPIREKHDEVKETERIPAKRQRRDNARTDGHVEDGSKENDKEHVRKVCKREIASTIDTLTSSSTKNNHLGCSSESNGAKYLVPATTTTTTTDQIGNASTEPPLCKWTIPQRKKYQSHSHDSSSPNNKMEELRHPPLTQEQSDSTTEIINNVEAITATSATSPKHTEAPILKLSPSVADSYTDFIFCEDVATEVEVDFEAPVECDQEPDDITTTVIDELQKGDTEHFQFPDVEDVGSPEAEELEEGEIKDDDDGGNEHHVVFKIDVGGHLEETGEIRLEEAVECVLGDNDDNIDYDSENDLVINLSDDDDHNSCQDVDQDCNLVQCNDDATNDSHSFVGGKTKEDKMEDVQIKGENLEENILEEKNLKENIMEEKNLEEDIMEERNLEEDIIEKRNFEEDIMEERNLEENIMEETNLEEDIMEETNLEEDIMEETNLEEDIMEETNLEEDIMEETNLEEDIIEETNLEKNMLEESILENDLENDILEENILEDNILENDLENDILKEAILKETILKENILQNDLENDIFEKNILEENILENNLENDILEEKILEENILENNLENNILEKKILKENILENDLENDILEEKMFDESIVEETNLEKNMVEEINKQEKSLENDLDNKILEGNDLKESICKINNLEKKTLKKKKLEEINLEGNNLEVTILKKNNLKQNILEKDHFKENVLEENNLEKDNLEEKALKENNLKEKESEKEKMLEEESETERNLEGKSVKEISNEEKNSVMEKTIEKNMKVEKIYESREKPEMEKEDSSNDSPTADSPPDPEDEVSYSEVEPPPPLLSPGLSSNGSPDHEAEIHLEESELDPTETEILNEFMRFVSDNESVERLSRIEHMPHDVQRQSPVEPEDAEDQIIIRLEIDDEHIQPETAEDLPETETDLKSNAIDAIGSLENAAAADEIQTIPVAPTKKIRQRKIKATKKSRDRRAATYVTKMALAPVPCGGDKYPKRVRVPTYPKKTDVARIMTRAAQRRGGESLPEVQLDCPIPLEYRRRWKNKEISKPLDVVVVVDEDQTNGAEIGKETCDAQSHNAAESQKQKLQKNPPPQPSEQTAKKKTIVTTTEKPEQNEVDVKKNIEKTVDGNAAATGSETEVAIAHIPSFLEERQRSDLLVTTNDDDKIDKTTKETTSATARKNAQLALMSAATTITTRKRPYRSRLQLPPLIPKFQLPRLKSKQALDTDDASSSTKKPQLLDEIMIVPLPGLKATDNSAFPKPINTYKRKDSAEKACAQMKTSSVVAGVLNSAPVVLLERESLKLPELATTKRPLPACSIKPCPSPASFIKQCPAPASAIKPCPSPNCSIKPCPSPNCSIKPCPSPNCSIKLCPSPASSSKPCPSPASSSKQCPSPASSNKPCLSPASSSKPCLSPASSSKPCPLLACSNKLCQPPPSSSKPQLGGAAKTPATRCTLLLPLRQQPWMKRPSRNHSGTAPASDIQQQHRVSRQRTSVPQTIRNLLRETATVSATPARQQVTKIDTVNLQKVVKLCSPQAGDTQPRTTRSPAAEVSTRAASMPILIDDEDDGQILSIIEQHPVHTKVTSTLASETVDIRSDEMSEERSPGCLVVDVDDDDDDNDSIPADLKCNPKYEQAASVVAPAIEAAAHEASSQPQVAGLLSITTSPKLQFILSKPTGSASVQHRASPLAVPTTPAESHTTQPKMKSKAKSNKLHRSTCQLPESTQKRAEHGARKEDTQYMDGSRMVGLPLKKHHVESVPIPHRDESVTVAQRVKFAQVQHRFKSDPVPDKNESAPALHWIESLDRGVPHPGESALVMQRVEFTPVPHQFESSPVIRRVESSPVSHRVEPFPVSHRVESSPGLHRVETAPVSQRVDSSPKLRWLESAPVSHRMESVLVSHQVRSAPAANQVESVPVSNRVKSASVPHRVNTTSVSHPTDSIITQSSQLNLSSGLPRVHSFPGSLPADQSNILFRVDFGNVLRQNFQAPPEMKHINCVPNPSPRQEARNAHKKAKKKKAASTVCRSSDCNVAKKPYLPAAGTPKDDKSCCGPYPVVTAATERIMREIARVVLPARNPAVEQVTQKQHVFEQVRHPAIWTPVPHLLTNRVSGVVETLRQQTEQHPEVAKGSNARQESSDGSEDLEIIDVGRHEDDQQYDNPMPDRRPSASPSPDLKRRNRIRSGSSEPVDLSTNIKSNRNLDLREYFQIDTDRNGFQPHRNPENVPGILRQLLKTNPTPASNEATSKRAPGGNMAANKQKKYHNTPQLNQQPGDRLEQTTLQRPIPMKPEYEKYFDMSRSIKNAELRAGGVVSAYEWRPKIAELQRTTTESIHEKEFNYHYAQLQARMGLTGEMIVPERQRVISDQRPSVNHPHPLPHPPVLAHNARTKEFTPATNSTRLANNRLQVLYDLVNNDQRPPDNSTVQTAPEPSPKETCHSPTAAITIRDWPRIDVNTTASYPVGPQLNLRPPDYTASLHESQCTAPSCMEKSKSPKMQRQPHAPAAVDYRTSPTTAFASVDPHAGISSIQSHKNDLDARRLYGNTIGVVHPTVHRDNVAPGHPMARSIGADDDSVNPPTQQRIIPAFQPPNTRQQTPQSADETWTPTSYSVLNTMSPARADCHSSLVPSPGVRSICFGTSGLQSEKMVAEQKGGRQPQQNVVDPSSQIQTPNSATVHYRQNNVYQPTPLTLSVDGSKCTDSCKAGEMDTGSWHQKTKKAETYPHTQENIHHYSRQEKTVEADRYDRQMANSEYINTQQSQAIHSANGSNQRPNLTQRGCATDAGSSSQPTQRYSDYSSGSGRSLPMHGMSGQSCQSMTTNDDNNRMTVGYPQYSESNPCYSMNVSCNLSDVMSLNVLPNPMPVVPLSLLYSPVPVWNHYINET